MNTKTVDSRTLERFLRRKKHATMAEMKGALYTQSDATVFRRLAQLEYLTSYSHNGRYYALKDVASFDTSGIWSRRSVHFSQWGTLVATGEAFVLAASAGYFVEELEQLLHVNVKDVLPKLAGLGRVTREKVDGRFLYCATKVSIRKRQLTTRHAEIDERIVRRLRADQAIVSDEIKAAIILFFSLLDEQQRRLFAGLESLKWGSSGDAKIAGLLGVDVKTVARGRRDLLSDHVDSQRVRKPGAGRKRAEKKSPSS